MAHTTAIGCGCLLGAGGSPHLHAAEWSVQPVISWSADYDSDRNLSVGSSASESAVLYGDLRLQRALESTQIVIEPKFDLRRYSDSIWGPGNDRSLNGAFTWTGEQMKTSFTGSIADQTTLIAELYETGIISTNTRRRASQANLEWDWSQSEHRQTFVQLGYLGASYSGAAQQLFPGYRYPTATLGERFFLSERLSFSVSAFGDSLISTAPGNSSHEYGGQGEVNYAYSETTTFDVAIGESKRVLTGERGSGTNAAVTASHTMSLGTASLNYTRSLVPYGIGYLVQRQQVAASMTRPLTPYLDLIANVTRIDNNSSTVRLGLDRPFYNNFSVGMNWKMGESWTLQPLVSTSWSKPIHTDTTVREWRAMLTTTWQPFPSSRSR
jgi:hypothetical protein